MLWMVWGPLITVVELGELLSSSLPPPPPCVCVHVRALCHAASIADYSDAAPCYSHTFYSCLTLLSTCPAEYFMSYPTPHTLLRFVLLSSTLLLYSSRLALQRKIQNLKNKMKSSTQPLLLLLSRERTWEYSFNRFTGMRAHVRLNHDR